MLYSTQKISRVEDGGEGTGTKLGDVTGRGCGEEPGRATLTGLGRSSGKLSAVAAALTPWTLHPLAGGLEVHNSALLCYFAFRVPRIGDG